MRLERLRLFDGDDAILADLLHGFGNNVPNGFVVVGADGADLRDHFAGDGLGELVEFALAALAGLFIKLATYDTDGFLDATFHGHRVSAGGYGFYAFAVDRLGEDRSGRGAVAGDIGSFRCHFAHHLRAHVFLRVLEFDFLGYGYAVLGDGGRTEFLFNHNVAALGAESDLHGIGQKVDAAEDRLPRLFSVYDLLCHTLILLSKFGLQGWPADVDLL